MTGTLVFTGPYGPGLSATTMNLSNLRTIEFDFAKSVVNVIDNQGRLSSYDIHNTTTFTASVTKSISMTETLSQ